MLVHYHHGRSIAKCRWTWCWNSSWEVYILIHQQGKRDSGPAWAFETSNPTSSDVLPPTKLQILIFLILPKSSIPWWLPYGGRFLFKPPQNSSFLLCIGPWGLGHLWSSVLTVNLKNNLELLERYASGVGVILTTLIEMWSLSYSGWHHSLGRRFWIL